MKIIIIGAGQVGSALSTNLVREGNDVTLIDTRQDLLEKISEKIDLKAIHGNGAFPSMLETAGAKNADVLIAVSHSDEINMVSCQVSYSIFNLPLKIARIRETEYLTHDNLFSYDSIPIDVLISPEILVSNNIENLIRHPGTIKQCFFANGKISIIGVQRAKEIENFDSVVEMQDELSKVNSHILFLKKDGKIIKYQDEEIPDYDELLFICESSKIDESISIIQQRKENKRIMIAGGEKITKHLADKIKSDFQVKLIESEEIKAEEFSKNMEDITVINGDPANEDILLQENIEHMDVFCALTKDDENNIISSILAKKLGAKKVISLINKTTYSELFEKKEIDVFMSAETLTIDTLLQHARKIKSESIYNLDNDNEELIEIAITSEGKEAKIIGKRIDQLDISKNIMVCCLIKNEEVIINFEKTLLEENDRLILYLKNRRYISDIENLFN